MDQQRRLEILLEENQEMTFFRERDFRKIEEDLKVEKDAYQAALTEVQPCRMSVTEALGNVGRSEVTELSSFVKPPRPVQTVCQCLSVLRGLENQDWGTAHSQLSDTWFMRSLRELDLDTITHKQVTSIKGLLKKITEEEMLKVSRAGVGMLKYLEAVLIYCDAARQVHLNKKKEKLAKMQEKYNHKRRELDKMYEDKISMETELQQLTSKDDSRYRANQLL